MKCNLTQEISVTCVVSQHYPVISSHNELEDSAARGVNDPRLMEFLWGSTCPNHGFLGGCLLLRYVQLTCYNAWAQQPVRCQVSFTWQLCWTMPRCPSWLAGTWRSPTEPRCSEGATFNRYTPWPRTTSQEVFLLDDGQAKSCYFSHCVLWLKNSNLRGTSFDHATCGISSRENRWFGWMAGW